MKNVAWLLLLCLALAVCGGCNSSAGTIGGADGPTEIYVSE